MELVPGRQAASLVFLPLRLAGAGVTLTLATGAFLHRRARCAAAAGTPTSSPPCSARAG